MKYEDIYKQAMQKIQPQPSWKQDTLQKMLNSKKRKKVLFPYKKIAISVAASISLIFIVDTFLPSISINPASSPESLELSQEETPIPKIALFSENADIDTIDFSATEVAPYPMEDLPESVQITTDTSSLPVWKQEEGTFTFLGDYPIVSSVEAIESSMTATPSHTQKSDMVVNLVYVQSAGYLQPAYSIALQSSDLPLQYVPAIGGEYYK